MKTPRKESPIYIKNRLFLVGCPRSGTTLLQSMFAAHPEVASYPESRFFRKLAMSRLRKHLGIAPAASKVTIENFLRTIEKSELVSFLPFFAVTHKQHVKAFLKILDTLTVSQGKSSWLEKTPEHLKAISYIEKVVPKAKFIHILRQGEDVVASLYEVTKSYPESWRSNLTIDQCIERWKTDIEISLEYIGKPRHICVQYEDLVENPCRELNKICEFIEIKFDQAMVSERHNVAGQIIRNQEKWKKDVASQIVERKSQKFHEVFTRQEKDHIERELAIFRDSKSFLEV